MGKVASAAAIFAPVLGLMIGLPGAAAADSPPPGWDDVRVLDCGGTQVTAAFTPGGVFTSFHVVGSDDVIVPKHVEVVQPGQTEPITTLHVRGFDRNQRDTVVCSYTDPDGLAVTLVGVRT